MHLYHQANDGFTVGKIAHERAIDPRWDVGPLSPEKESQVEKILGQRFSYLGKGHQAFVFVSEDGDYVLKFFKYPPIREFKWLDHLAWIPPVAAYRSRHLERNAERAAYLESLYGSWKLAYEKLPTQTQVVYLHLNRTDGQLGPLTLVDRIGMEHEIDLDQSEFLIQRRAEMFGPLLEGMLADQDLQGARGLIDGLVDLIESDYELGLADNDHALIQNTGWVDGRPIHVDTGMLVTKPALSNPEVRRQVLWRHTEPFSKWLEERSPELALYLKERTHAIE